MPNPTRVVMGSAAYAGRVDPTEIATVAADGPCPYGRHLSYVTGEYTIQVGYKELSDIADMIVDVWDRLRLDATDEKLGAAFESLLAHVDGLREWTGWAGVPGEYVGNSR